MGEPLAPTGAQDFYRLLQVDPDVPQELIAEAYWRLVGRLQARRHWTPGPRRQFAALNEAYATLISPARRMAYGAALPRVERLRRERAHANESSSRRSWLPLPRRRHARLGPSRRLDCYAVLGIDPSAEAAIVDLAYSVMRVLHSEGPISMSRELSEAYAVLADPARRAAYDAQLSTTGESAELPSASEDLPPAAPDVPASAPQSSEPAVAKARQATWLGMAAAASLSERFVRWAWPVVRDGSRRFAAWAWPIVRRWTRQLTVWAWRATKALARLASGAIKGAIAEYQQRQVLTQAIDDDTVRSRLSRRPTPVQGDAPATRDESPQVRPQPLARLTVEEGPQAGTLVELRQQPVTLGADDGCTLPLTDKDGRVSKEHALIWRRQGRFMICQLAAGQPGILIGGRAIPWAVLEDGDRIEIGDHVVRFELLEPTNGASGRTAATKVGAGRRLSR
jgi:curved DNA-binding protein CbpA/pSer/pThr/pTyr-binding forkhead associated (FHA) protein